MEIAKKVVDKKETKTAIGNGNPKKYRRKNKNCENIVGKIKIAKIS